MKETHNVIEANGYVLALHIIFNLVFPKGREIWEDKWGRRKIGQEKLNNIHS